MEFDAVLVLSFGGPDGPDDVIPFLQNVLRGRPVPPDRLQQVASHYFELGGRSPINAHNCALVDAVSDHLEQKGRPLPVYWGNRNWRPFVADTVATMKADRIKRAAVFVTSAYSSYSSCRQYLDDLARASEAAGPGGPDLVKLPPFFDRPGFIGPLAEGLAAARRQSPDAPVLMTAHSIPESMAATSAYADQLAATAEHVAARAGVPGDGYRLAYQSRSGPPTQPWLGPDILEAIQALPPDTTDLIVVPIGFVSDHMEVVYDLDTQARQEAGSRGIRMLRTATPGLHPDFVDMIYDLVAEAEQGETSTPRLYCHAGCCPAPIKVDSRA